jgi:hypothetical protein
MSLFQLFKKKPSDDIINEVLHITGFNSLDDPKEVSRTYLDSDEVIEKYLEIQENVASFYIPCKSKKYIIDTPTGKNIITIIRHMLKTRGYSVQSQEKYKSGQKTTVYKIIPKTDANNNNELHVIKFD